MALFTSAGLGSGTVWVGHAPLAKVIGCVGLASLFVVSGSIEAQSRTDLSRRNACRAFVQKFYDWYSVDEGGLESVLEHSALDDELRQLIKDELSWQDAHKDEVDLDYDPFLNTNYGPEGRYVAGKVWSKDGHYWVQVYQLPLNWYGPSGRPEHRRAVATPEVAFKGGRCVFVNFHYTGSKYPEDDDLVSILKSLTKSHTQDRKR